MKAVVTGFRFQCPICGETKETVHTFDGHDGNGPERVLFTGKIGVIKHVRNSHRSLNGEGYGLKEAKDVVDAAQVVEGAVRAHRRFLVEQELVKVRCKMIRLESELESLNDFEEIGGIVPRPFQVQQDSFNTESFEDRMARGMGR